MPAGFLTRADRLLARTGSLLCVGLDPDPALMPRSLARSPARSGLRRFVRGIVEATRPYAAAFKMQLACYLNYGPEGLAILRETVRTIGPGRITILDLKATDFPNTMRLYHDAVFSQFGFDAATLTPWMGRDSLEPFARDRTHGIFLVAHSSNPGAADLQDPPRARRPAWVEVVRWVRTLQQRSGNAGAVVGATYPAAVARARQILGPSGLLLVPGIGRQHGDLAASVRAGVGREGRGLLVAASRSVMHASRGNDWRDAAAMEAARLLDQINGSRR